MILSVDTWRIIAIISAFVAVIALTITIHKDRFG